MFGIGVGELFVIFIIAVVVIGPHKLPEVARTIGKLVATAKRTTNQLRDQMHEEVRKFEDMEEVKEFKSVVQSELYNMQDTAKNYVQNEIEQEEKRLEDEARDIERAFTAEGGPDTAAAAEPSIAPPAEDPAAQAPAAAGQSAAAEDGRTASAGAAFGETAGPALSGDAPTASGSNGGSPGHAEEDRTPLAPASGTDKPAT
jgi:sec-independent protein translocase protein TatB